MSQLEKGNINARKKPITLTLPALDTAPYAINKIFLIFWIYIWRRSKISFGKCVGIIGNKVRDPCLRKNIILM